MLSVRKKKKKILFHRHYFLSLTRRSRTRNWQENISSLLKYKRLVFSGSSQDKNARFHSAFSCAISGVFLKQRQGCMFLQTSRTSKRVSANTCTHRCASVYTPMHSFSGIYTLSQPRNKQNKQYSHTITGCSLSILSIYI